MTQFLCKDYFNQCRCLISYLNLWLESLPSPDLEILDLRNGYLSSFTTSISLVLDKVTSRELIGKKNNKLARNNLSFICAFIWWNLSIQVWERSFFGDLQPRNRKFESSPFKLSPSIFFLLFRFLSRVCFSRVHQMNSKQSLLTQKICFFLSLV